MAAPAEQPRAAPGVLEQRADRRPDPGPRAAARRPAGRTTRVRAVAVHARVRPTLRRRAHRVPAGTQARYPVRAAPRHAGIRDTAGVLAGWPRVRGTRH